MPVRKRIIDVILRDIAEMKGEPISADDLAKLHPEMTALQAHKALVSHAYRMGAGSLVENRGSQFWAWRPQSTKVVRKQREVVERPATVARGDTGWVVLATIADGDVLLIDGSRNLWRARKIGVME